MTRDLAEIGVADGWYSRVPGMVYPPRAFASTPALRRLPIRLRDALAGLAPTRGIMLFLASTRYPVVGVCREQPGSATLTLLRALLGRRRKLVVFQFIVHPRRSPLRHLLGAVDRWAIRRALLRGHVLTAFEVQELARWYALDPARFGYVPWPLGQGEIPPLAPLPTEALVLCAGRAYCDWETLFTAARGADWPLHVVCSRSDASAVRRLNVVAGGPATVHVDLPQDAFDALGGKATVSVAALRETAVSSGHIRVAHAFTGGVPLVATATHSLEDYVQDGVDGLLVAPADADALRRAVDRLLDDRALAERLRRAAHAQACERRERDYFAALGALVAEGLAST